MTEELERIKKEVLDCKNCPLHKGRIENGYQSVFGDGHSQANIMLIGEAPGLNEAQTGRPFCGAAGKTLDELLEFVGIKREEVFITNILKCRPPDNRDPNKEEVKACASYLERQIEIIKPKVICTLGNHSTRHIFEKNGLGNQLEGISKIHGKIFESKSLFELIKIIPLYHPAVVSYNANMKEVLKEDFKILNNIS